MEIYDEKFISFIKNFSQIARKKYFRQKLNIAGTDLDPDDIEEEKIDIICNYIINIILS